MKFRTLSIIPLLLFGTTLANGAVIMVSPGQRVQAAVDGANSGDEIIIQGGVFNENITINSKSLHFRSFSTTSEIHSLNFLNTPGQSTIQNLQLSELNATNSNLLVKRATIGKNVNIEGGKFQILQSIVTEKLTCKASVSHILYNDIRYAEIEGNSTITGNHFDGRGLLGIGIDLNGSHTKASIRNNLIHDYEVSYQGQFSNACIGIRINEDVRSEIINNIIYECRDMHHGGWETEAGMGIYVKSNAGTTILGNIIWDCYIWTGTDLSSDGSRLIWAPSSSVILENNSLWYTNEQAPELVGGGVISRNTVGYAKFNDLQNGDFTLASDSPCIDAGPPDPQYNDRDGSRNDIGMFGGHNFIPDGRTTNKPIVLGLDIAPIAVPTGGTVTIESTGATVK